MDFNDATGSTTPTGWTCIDDVGDALTHALANFITGSTSDGVTLKGTTSFFTSPTLQAIPAWSNSEATWVDNNVFNDYTGMYANRTGQITISGLSPTTVYQVEILSARNTAISSDTSYLVGPTGNTVAGAIIDGDGSTTAWNAKDDGYTGDDFMRWSSVIPGTDGLIVLDVDTGSSNTYFNGMRISAIPEPSTFMMLILGGFGLLIARRWRRR